MIFLPYPDLILEAWVILNLLDRRCLLLIFVLFPFFFRSVSVLQTDSTVRKGQAHRKSQCDMS